MIQNLDKVFIVAELSGNHGGSLKVAIDTIKAAREVGADAIKLQTYTPDTMTINSDRDYFRVKHGTVWDGLFQYGVYQDAYTPWEWHEELFKVAKEEGLVCFSSPFDNSSVDFLETLDNPIYKIASPEIVHTPLIEYIARKGKPIIFSTGIAELPDLELAISTCRGINPQLALAVLKCTAQYPAPLEKANLITMMDYVERFDVIPGLSDHTLGIISPIVATTLGAKIIEKHFIIDRSIKSPDASFSLDKAQFAEMVNGVRDAEKAIGSIHYIEKGPDVAARGIRQGLYLLYPIVQQEKY